MAFTSNFINDQLPICQGEMGHHYLSKEFIKLCEVAEPEVRPLLYGKRMKLGPEQELVPDPGV